MTIKAVKANANQTLRKRGDTKELGKNLYSNFLVRHAEFKTTRSRTLDQARRDADDPEIMQA